MQNILGTIQTLILCGTIMVIAFVVLLSLPQSKLRAFLLPIVSWGVAIFCGIYCISPVDIMPEVILGPLGLIDDVGALVAGIAAAQMAMTSEEEV